MSLSIIGGKFYKNGNEVPPVIGDREQIECLQKANRDAEILEMEGEPIDVEVDVSIEATYKCKCGGIVRFSTSGNDDMSEAESCLEGKTTKCKCGRKYQISNDEEWVVKQIEGPK